MADVTEKIIQLLRDDVTLQGLLNPDEPVGYIQVDQATQPPYVLVQDITATDLYGLGNQATHRNAVYDIEVVTELVGDNASGYTRTKPIQARIATLLQNQESVLVNEEGATVCLRRGKKLPSRVITMSGGEQYLRRGYEWQVVTSS